MLYLRNKAILLYLNYQYIFEYNYFQGLKLFS